MVEVDAVTPTSIMSGYAQQPGRERLASASARVEFRLFISEPYVGRASPEVL